MMTMAGHPPALQLRAAHDIFTGNPGSLTGRPLRLYADGIFDLFHVGHAKALQQVKEAYPNCTVIAGCCNDAMTHQLKGRTVLKDTERYEALRHCKWVDEVITDAPWVLTDEFLEKHAIDFVCHDALPYADASGDAAAEDGDVYLQLKKRGMFHETQRTEGISTSELIVRVLRDYDTFLHQALKRGYSAEDLNVSWTTVKQVQLHVAIEQAKATLARLWEEWRSSAESFMVNTAEDLDKIFRSSSIFAAFNLRGGTQIDV